MAKTIMIGGKNSMRLHASPTMRCRWIVMASPARGAQGRPKRANTNMGGEKKKRGPPGGPGGGWWGVGGGAPRQYDGGEPRETHIGPGPARGAARADQRGDQRRDHRRDDREKVDEALRKCVDRRPHHGRQRLARLDPPPPRETDHHQQSPVDQDEADEAAAPPHPDG